MNFIRALYSKIIFFSKLIGLSDGFKLFEYLLKELLLHGYCFFLGECSLVVFVAHN
jgi:hypothetical protein